MKTTKMTALLVLLSASMSLMAETYSGNNGYGEIIGSLPGTEKYTYTVNESGKKVIDGNYTFSGEKSLSNNQMIVTGKNSIITSAKNGMLNGVFTQKANYSGKEFSFTKGWTPFSFSSNLSGTFANGEPCGNFVAKYDGNTQEAGNATMKNGKYIGEFNYRGFANREYITLKGQLTADGQLTGKWQYISAGIFDCTYTFDNNVAITADYGNNGMPPSLTEMAKKFANGTISEAQLNEQGIYVEERTLPLNYIVELFLKEEFSLNKIPAKCSFDKYLEGVKYKELTQLNAFNDEGFELFLRFIEENGNYNQIELDNYKYMCSTRIQFDKKYKLYYVTANDAFLEKYAKRTNNNSLYFSDKQFNEYNEAFKRYLAKNAQPFLNFIAISSYCSAAELEIDKNVWTLYQNNAQNFLQLMTQYSNKFRQIENNYSKAIEDVTNMNFTHDSTFMYRNHDEIYEYTPKYIDTLSIILSLVQQADELKLKFEKRKDEVRSTLKKSSSNKFFQAITLSFKDEINKYGDDYINGNVFLDKYTYAMDQIHSMEENNKKINEICQPWPKYLETYQQYYNSIELSSYEDVASVSDNIQKTYNQVSITNQNITKIKENDAKIRTIFASHKKCMRAYTIIFKTIILDIAQDLSREAKILDNLTKRLETEPVDLQEMEDKVRKIKTAEDVISLWELE